MSSSINNPSKLAFSSQCIPGSVAEQQELERLATFQRNKALRLAEEARNQPEVDAQRNEAYEANFAENQERMKRSRAARNTNRGF